MTFVFNASPLIVLAKAGLLHEVMSLGDKVIIPDAVALEIGAVDDMSDPSRLWVNSPATAHLIMNTPDISPFVAAWDLGAGESAVITIAHRDKNCMAVLDDLAARRCAAALGLRAIGTLGLILMAKQKGILGSVRRALDSVIVAGLYISPKHIDQILSEAGES